MGLLPTLLVLLATALLAQTTAAFVPKAIAKSSSHNQTELTYAGSNSAASSSRVKRHAIGLPADAVLMCIHNLGLVDYFGSSNGAYSVNRGSNAAALVQGTQNKRVTKIDVYPSHRIPGEYNVLFVFEDSNKMESIRNDAGNKLAVMQNQKNELEQSNANLNQNLLLKNKDIDLLKTDLENNKLMLSGYGLMMKELENKLRDSKREAEKVQNDLDKISVVKASMVKEHEEELSKINLEIERLQSKLNDSSGELEKFEEEKTKLNSEVEDLNGLISKLGGEIEGLKSKNDKLQAIIPVLEEDSVLFANDIQQLKEKLKIRDEAIKGLEDQLLKIGSDLKLREDKVAGVEAQLNETTASMHAIEAELEKLNAEKSELQKLVVQFNSLDSDRFFKVVVDRYKDTIDSLNAEIVNLMGTICP